MAKKNNIEEQELSGLERTLDRANSYLKEHKKEHYNFVERHDYKVSTGSLKFDMVLNGGFGPGIQRFYGVNEGGKTSCALQVAASFQKQVPNSFVVYIKAEGRLSDTMIKRSGIDTSKSKWLVLSTNEFECTFRFIKEMIENNTEDTRFCFIIDSVDSLTLEVDRQKPLTDPQKVAGGALMCSVFMRQMSAPIDAYGHMLILISQVRSLVDTKGYGGPTTSPSGGNALKHYANEALEFRSRYESDYIYENPTAASRAAKGNRIGHFCKVLFLKDMNEKTGTEISYPIKYGRTDGQSVWKEYEILKLLESWKMFDRKGPWISLSEDTIKLVKDKNLGLDENSKWCGENKFLEFFEQNPNVTNFFIEYFKAILNKSIISKEVTIDDSISDGDGQEETGQL